MNADSLILQLYEEAFERKTWHGPNLWQSLKGVSAKQAAWRPGPNRHKYLGSGVARRLLEIRRSAALAGRQAGIVRHKGQQFFPAPAAWEITGSPVEGR